MKTEGNKIFKTQNTAIQIYCQIVPLVGSQKLYMLPEHFRVSSIYVEGQI